MLIKKILTSLVLIACFSQSLNAADDDFHQNNLVFRKNSKLGDDFEKTDSEEQQHSTNKWTNVGYIAASSAVALTAAATVFYSLSPDEEKRNNYFGDTLMGYLKNGMHSAEDNLKLYISSLYYKTNYNLSDYYKDLVEYIIASPKDVVKSCVFDYVGSSSCYALRHYATAVLGYKNFFSFGLNLYITGTFAAFQSPALGAALVGASSFFISWGLCTYYFPRLQEKIKTN